MTALWIDDLSRPFPAASSGARWEMLSDRVMGGVSAGRLVREAVGGRDALRMTGEVSLENNGGFLQMALDLSPSGGPVDASGFTGIEFTACGNGEAYGLHLRTTDLTRPWQSYRAGFTAAPGWRVVRLDFAGFEPHRTEVALNPARLRRIGFAAIGRAFAADLAIGGVAFF